MDEKKRHISEILCQQIELLAEESKNIQPNDKGYKPFLIEYSQAICQIADTYARFFRYWKNKDRVEMSSVFSAMQAVEHNPLLDMYHSHSEP